MAKDLPSFIRSLGIDKAAELFEETPRAVKGWMYGERTPRRITAAKIVDRANGKVTWAGIYGTRGE